MGNHYAVRLQRAVIQEWKVDVPWAKAGEATVANGGDIMKEAGLFPADALAPEGARPIRSPVRPRHPRPCCRRCSRPPPPAGWSRSRARPRSGALSRRSPRRRRAAPPARPDAGRVRRPARRPRAGRRRARDRRRRGRAARAERGLERGRAALPERPGRADRRGGRRLGAGPALERAGRLAADRDAHGRAVPRARRPAGQRLPPPDPAGPAASVALPIAAAAATVRSTDLAAAPGGAAIGALAGRGDGPAGRLPDRPGRPDLAPAPARRFARLGAAAAVSVAARDPLAPTAGGRPVAAAVAGQGLLGDLRPARPRLARGDRRDDARQRPDPPLPAGRPQQPRLLRRARASTGCCRSRTRPGSRSWPGSTRS